MAYEVKLDVFEGPIDLLLHLITRQRVDIYDVSLATITDEYLSAVRHLGPLDLEIATGFLVVAATLLELKSARLLPAARWDDEHDHLLEERDLLLARLVECATYRDAGTWMAGELVTGEAWHPRRVALEEGFVALAPDVLARTGPTDIARVAALLLAPASVVELDTSHVAPLTASVGQAIADLADRLAVRGAASFEELCGHVDVKIEVVVRFLAILEMFKAGAVDLGQADRFGTIEVRWTGDVDAAEVVAGAEEYTLADEVATR